jgi:hypothetical protein
MTDESNSKEPLTVEGGPAGPARRFGLVLLRIVCGITGLSLLPVIRFFFRAMISAFNPLNLTWFVGSSTVCVLFLWLAMRGHVARDRELIRTAWLWGFMISLAGFILGYLVVPPIYGAITGKNPSLGPLLGIFVVGPAGFPVGVIIGLLIGLKKSKRG